MVENEHGNRRTGCFTVSIKNGQAEEVRSSPAQRGGDREYPFHRGLALPRFPIAALNGAAAGWSTPIQKKVQHSKEKGKRRDGAHSKETRIDPWRPGVFGGQRSLFGTSLLAPEVFANNFPPRKAEVKRPGTVL